MNNFVGDFIQAVRGFGIPATLMATVGMNAVVSYGRSNRICVSPDPVARQNALKYVQQNVGRGPACRR